jgi:uncharacterized glyoxalase superfamily protein PhnB
MQFLPYLIFDDRCEEAFRFYAQALDGEILHMQTHGDSPVAGEVPAEWHPRIIHARLVAGDAVLMGSDSPPEYYKPPQGMYVSIHADDVNEVPLPGVRRGAADATSTTPSAWRATTTSADRQAHRRRGAAPGQHRDDRARAQRRRRRFRRAVRRDEGAARRLLPGRCRRPGRRDPRCREDPGGAHRQRRGPAGARAEPRTCRADTARAACRSRTTSHPRLRACAPSGRRHLPHRVAPRARHADPRARRLRPGRGRAARRLRRRRASSGRATACRQPARLAGLGRALQGDRRAAPARPLRRVAGEIARRLEATPPVVRGPDDDVEDDRLRLIFTCCHPALPPTRGRADAARGLRPHHRGDRPRVPHRPAHPGAADRARQGEDPRRAHPVPRARARRPAGAARHRAARHLPRLQRGLLGVVGRALTRATSRARRSGWAGCCWSCCRSRR